MVLIQLDIEDDEIDTCEAISVSQILSSDIGVERNDASYDFDYEGPVKLCEDIPCCSHSLDLLQRLTLKRYWKPFDLHL
jgi:hypothetical protein